MKPYILLTLFFLAATAHAAPPRVSLPEAGVYAYWVQSASGAVAQMPVTVTGKAQFGLDGAETDGTLYVLDKHTGGVAAKALTGKPLTLTTADFHPLTPAAIIAPLPAPPTAAAPAAPPPETGGFARLVTLVFGLLVAAGVGWVLLYLYRTRGQPLIDIARRLGLEVPDPNTLNDAEESAPVYTPPAPRAPDKIPDEAGVAPPRQAAPLGTRDAPQIVSIQGASAGRTFVLPPGEITVGRDSDNGIVLADETVSRRHARLFRDGGGGISISDTDSANGIYVNGSRVAQAALSGGDRIQIGDNHFHLEI